MRSTIVVLADDDLADLGGQLLDEGGLLVDQLVDDPDVHGSLWLWVEVAELDEPAERGAAYNRERPLGYFRGPC